MRDHSPVQKEPEYGFHIVVELMPPPVVLGLILQIEWINEFLDFLLNVVDSGFANVASRIEDYCRCGCRDDKKLSLMSPV